MAATVASSRRSTSVSSTSTQHSSSPSISKGATARSAAGPRVSSNLTPASRRNSTRLATPPPTNANGESHESLSAALRQETDAKEQLLLQLQNKDSVVSSLTDDNDHLTSALNAAESRLAELYAEQNRMEEEMAARIEVADKLRAQTRELEKENRDLQRRYNEQSATFEAERQAFYDNEVHLKSRIQSLIQARKNPPPHQVTRSPSVAELTEDEQDEEPTHDELAVDTASEEASVEPAEMTALRLELSTLENSYSSMQSTVALLQNQLNDLKRVNRSLQEENESYNILLREKTLNGQFDVLLQMGTTTDSANSSDRDDDVDVRSTLSASNTYLDTVDEHPDELLDPDFSGVLDDAHESNEDTPSRSSSHSRHGRRHQSSLRSPRQQGESLADLPISGPGLDLAAELGRAENKGVIENRVDPSNSGSGKRGKKGTDHRNATETRPATNEVDAMKSKIRVLEDANKALTLYASKIIDRIIAQEGFEHVLAVDYDVPKSLPSPPLQQPPPKAEKAARRASMFARTSEPADMSPTTPKMEKLTTFDSIHTTSANNALSSSSANKRRSLSFDWRAFSLFGEKKPEVNPHLRPLTLQAGGAIVTGNRKLDNYEDEEDRRERERLQATMKLMGIEKPAPPQIQKSLTAPETGSRLSSESASVMSTPSSRFSFFRRGPVTSDSSAQSSSASEPLTQDALVHAEAENSLAALDAHERRLSAELAKGGSSGFTEIQRKSRRSRASGRESGSGSTVWSAGLSRAGDDGDE